MILLNIFCSLFWLFWLLPLLLGLLLWWLGNRKYESTVADYEGKISGLNNRIGTLEGDVDACASKKAELEGDLAITKGRMREMESDMKSLKSSKGGSTKSAASSLSASSSKAAEPKKEDPKPSSSSTSSTSTPSADISGIVSPLTSAGSTGSTGSSGTSNSGNSSSSTSGAGSGSKKSIYAGVKADNLQIIEGIGPKMESVLKENGVSSHSSLSNQSFDDLKAILNKYGDKYKIIDPKTWPQQAKYAANNDFDGLIDYQKKLDAGKDNASKVTDSKLEKYLIKTGALKAWKQDDLKAIEGIGPATERLLHDNGIKTWRELANTSSDALKGILTAAGSRFALGDPTTWPKQAELAADGEFDKLREYQDFLDGGRG